MTNLTEQAGSACGRSSAGWLTVLCSKLEDSSPQGVAVPGCSNEAIRDSAHLTFCSAIRERGFRSWAQTLAATSSSSASTSQTEEGSQGKGQMAFGHVPAGLALFCKFSQKKTHPEICMSISPARIGSHGSPQGRL